MIPFLNKAAAREYYDAICHTDCREAVGDQQSHLSFGQLGKALKHFELTARVQSRSRLVQNKQLRVAEIGAGERHLLPLPTGELASSPKTAAEHLIVAAGQLAYDGVGEALVSGEFDLVLLLQLLDTAYCNV